LLAHRIKGVKTINDAKKFKSIYRQMLDLAISAGDESAAASVRDILAKI